MPSSKSSLITLTNLSAKQVGTLFSKGLELKKKFNQNPIASNHSFKGNAALLFLEPSTRTRFSFESACTRAGLHPLLLDGRSGASLEKGESIEDTILNIEALRPLFFVIRCNGDFNLNDIQKKLSVPIINGGWGMRGHPTQALLDAMTIFEKWGDLYQRQILFVGDIKHSRVVSSHLELAKISGYKIGFVAPKNFLPDVIPDGVQLFKNLDEGLQWADAVIALRVQNERHDEKSDFSLADYRENYGLNNKRLMKLKPNSMVMHPGPINYGVEIESEILADVRSVILKQVENGVFLREALIRDLMNGAL
ncbi:MAG: aspartate carbamoyltransferase catalytic subunit [Bdellovibrionaceae bacterium]|nr:aspartate carbamoyltransferase catalytic subunit [Bdellovibrio sp.]